ncbi:uncharacterized protein WCC33_013284 [Rhinophrynus dorsalis]
MSHPEAKLEVITDASPVVVKVGDTVHLKCILKLEKQQVDLKQLMVQWFTRGKQVAEFDHKIVIDKPGLSLSMDALQKGDATLTIASASAEHTGNYRCYVYYASDVSMKQIVLEVDDPSKPKEEDLGEISPSIHTDKILESLRKLDGKMDELIKETSKCIPPRNPKTAPAK